MPTNPKVTNKPATKGDLAHVLIMSTIAMSEIMALVMKVLGPEGQEAHAKLIEAINDRFRQMDADWEELTGFTEDE